jgi:hypothetical protein
MRRRRRIRRIRTRRVYGHAGHGGKSPSFAGDIDAGGAELGVACTVGLLRSAGAEGAGGWPVDTACGASGALADADVWSVTAESESAVVVCFSGGSGSFGGGGGGAGCWPVDTACGALAALADADMWSVAESESAVAVCFSGGAG